MQKERFQMGFLVGPLINGLINGIINWFQVKNEASILLADDQISSTTHTVMSGSVMLAASLGFIMTSVAYQTWKQTEKPAYWWSGFQLCLKHAFMAFGALVLVGVLLSRYFTEVYVSPIQSALIAGLVATLTSIWVEQSTKNHILRWVQR